MAGDKGVALVAGVGPGLGLGAARAFAQAGYRVGLSARKEDALRAFAAEIGPTAFPVPMDVREPASVAEGFGRAAEFGPIRAVVFNTGAQLNRPFLDTEPALYEKVWRLGQYGAVLVAQAALRAMLADGQGTLIFTGATASVRGNANFAAFAASKAGLRALAQSLAREFGPQGIHIAHVIIDGLIASPVIRERFPDAEARLGPDGMLDPLAIGRAYVMLAEQPRSAWTFELDLRPWAERF